MTIDVEYYRELCSNPGKFEAEGPETSYFHYERMGEGDGEAVIAESGFPEEAPQADLFETTAEEMEAFDIGSWLLLWEDDRGFAYSLDFDSREEAETFWNEYNI